MTITANRITAAAGICATVAGAIYVGVQINHPPADVEHVVTTEMLVREIAKAVMAVLAIAGFAGMFVHSRHRLGALGIGGYMLLTVGYLALFANQVIVACVLPTVAESDPGYVQDYLTAAVGGSPEGDIGHMSELFLITGIGYAIGGLLFGIALFRAGALARWACLLLSVGTVSALALSALPDSFNRPFAVPVGLALMGLGHSLWSSARATDDDDTTALQPTMGGAQLDPAGAE